MGEGSPSFTGLRRVNGPIFATKNVKKGYTMPQREFRHEALRFRGSASMNLYILIPAQLLTVRACVLSLLTSSDHHALPSLVA